jgi:hypothetical protein
VRRSKQGRNEAREWQNINTQSELCSMKICAARFSVCEEGTKVCYLPAEGNEGGEE